VLQITKEGAHEEDHYGALFLATITGCQPANISAVMRGSDRENSSMETRCEETDMRNNSEMQQVFK
jgi:hypothetical protein